MPWTGNRQALVGQRKHLDRALDVLEMDRPHRRRVEVALVLELLENFVGNQDATRGGDPDDPATRILDDYELSSFTDSLDSGALRGARLGKLTESVVEITESSSLGEKFVENSRIRYSYLVPRLGIDRAMQISSRLDVEAPREEFVRNLR